MGNVVSQKEHDETYAMNTLDELADTLREKVADYSKAKDDGTAKTSPHYNQSEIQPIEAMQANMSPERFLGMLQGSSMKYLMRMGHKDTEIKDARKASQYATWLVEALEGKIIDPRK